MERKFITHKRTDETGREIFNFSVGRVQKRILRKENGTKPKTNRKPAIRIKYHSGIAYSPPPVENKTVVHLQSDEDCQFFTIMSIRSGLEYAAIVKTDAGFHCYLPNVKLSKPGLYKFKTPDDGEKFETYGKLNICKVRIIEQIGM